MATKMRPEMSMKKSYYISKHRYYELKHFVMQYPEWIEYVRDMEGKYPTFNPQYYLNNSSLIQWRDPTAQEAERMDRFYNNIRVVTDCIQTAFDGLSPEYEAPCKTHYDILDAIVHGDSYDVLKARCDVPFGREYYYNRYRRFFWLLSQVRN